MPRLIKGFKIIFLIVSILYFFSISALAANVEEIKFTPQNQLKIILSAKGDFKISTLENPHRLIVDIKDAQLKDPKYKPINPAFVSSFRSKQNKDSLRLVFELTQKISVQKSRFEKVKSKKSGIITIEFSNIKTSTKSVTKVEAKTAVQTSKPKGNPEQNFILNKVEEFETTTTKIINPDGSAKYLVKKIPKNIAICQRIPVIVIDAGHGGKDPGTIGNFARTKEKNITLSYAKEFAKQLNNTKRYKAYLTRDKDFFIPLRQRVEKARKIKADLFISLHANATSDSEVEGFSIYTLSETSSDKQAELLAQKENRADIINGVNFDGASADIMKTLIDLSQRETKNSSARFANIAINVVKNSDIKILQNTHRFAGFAVLTAPDMSSVLIELGYLSNKHEEKLLNSLSYKRKVAEDLVTATDNFFAKN